MPLVNIRETTCLLCGCKLTYLGNDRQKHPKSEYCLVQYTDLYGVAVDGLLPLDDEKPSNGFSVEGLTTFPPVEKVCHEVFKSFGVPRLGGKSSGRGWSSVSTFQRCRHLWRRKYRDNAQPFIEGVEAPALAIGTLIHTFCAIFYTRMFDPNYPITPELMRDRLMAQANPDLVTEGWRVFVAYAIYYKHENIMPLAVEFDLRDPRTNDSCRYDLIAFFPEDVKGSGTRSDGLLPGTYNVEHKSASRFDHATLNGWANDGEVLGQMNTWELLKLDKRFGPLRGTIVNLLGKQKDPQFHRVVVGAHSWQTKQHRADLKTWAAEIAIANATGHFPRSRANCNHRYGLCDFFEECASVAS